MECRDKEFCKIPKQVCIPLSENSRIFSSVSHSSYKWKKHYNGRIAVERVNSRIDKMFGFRITFTLAVDRTDIVEMRSGHQRSALLYCGEDGTE